MRRLLGGHGRLALLCYFERLCYCERFLLGVVRRFGALRDVVLVAFDFFAAALAPLFRLLFRALAVPLVPLVLFVFPPEDLRFAPAVPPWPVSPAGARLMSLLKWLSWPLAVSSWWRKASPFSSKALNHSSHEIGCSDSSPLYPGKSMRIVPGSLAPPVPLMHVECRRAPRPSAGFRRGRSSSCHCVPSRNASVRLVNGASLY